MNLSDLERRAGSLADAVGKAASSALIIELETWPKPGLVSHVDAGSHHDMDDDTFRRSAAAIEPFFAAFVEAGAAVASMDDLRVIGRHAEAAMMAVTGGVNTHRGAIFGLGLLSAAAGVAHADIGWRSPKPFSADRLTTIVRRRWGPAIVGTPPPPGSHGGAALRRFGAGGARRQAASGFRHVLELGLPSLRSGRRLAPGDPEAARVQAFFELLAVVDDTNLLHRAGEAGLRYAHAQAASFLADGGVAQPGWREEAVAVHRRFVRHRLSPGGCADLLAITLFLDLLEDCQ